MKYRLNSLITLLKSKSFHYSLLGFLLLLVATTPTMGQDILIFKTGDEIQAKVTEVTPTEIKYKQFDNPDGPLITVNKSDVFMIKYQNGTKEVIRIPIQKVESSENLSLKGRQDAAHYYHTSVGGGVFIATVIGSPIIGLITGIACSGAPKEENLSYPNSSLMKNTVYKDAYKSKARSMKNRAIGTGLALGMLLDLIVVVAILNH